MAELTSEVLQTSQETPPAQGSESDPTAEFTQESGGEEQPEHSNESPDQGKPDDQAGQQQEQRPSRVERRISSLIGKLKEANGQQPASPRFGQQNQAVISQQEIEEGALDPYAFEQRIQQRIASEVDTRVNQAIQMNEVNIEYKHAVQEHEADLQSIADQNLDPDIEAEAAAEYNRLNHQTNPITGELMFVPAVKFSEIVSKLTARAERLAAKMASQTREYRHGVSQTSAVPASGNLSNSKRVGGDTTDFSEFEQAFASKA